jgi:uncharacterized protein (TIGR02246 family)
MAERHKDEQCIRAVWARLGAAWSAADSLGCAAGWAADSDHCQLAPGSPVRQGRDEIQRALTDAFARRPATYSRCLVCVVVSTRFLDDDVAVVDGHIDLSAGIGLKRTFEPAVSEPFTAVMMKRSSEWLIAASRVGTASVTHADWPFGSDSRTPAAIASPARKWLS